MLGDQIGAGRFVADGAALHQAGFPTVDIRPARDPGLLHRGFHYNKLDPARESSAPSGVIGCVKRAVALAVVALDAVGAGTRLPGPPASAIPALSRGDNALRDDQTFAAIEAYSGAIELRPESMLAYLRRGQTYKRRGDRGDLDAAARDFRKAAALDPTAVAPLEELGDVNYQLQRYGRAAEAYERDLKLDDRSARLSYKLALARYRDGDVDAALDALAQAVRLDDRQADAHYLLGLCLRDKQPHAEGDARVRTGDRARTRARFRRARSSPISTAPGRRRATRSSNCRCSPRSIRPASNARLRSPWRTRTPGMRISRS